MFKKNQTETLGLLTLIFFMMTGLCLADSLLIQKNLVIQLIEADDLEGARQATQTLIADYDTHTDISMAICDIADHYRGKNYQENSRKLYQYLADHWPSDGYAMWARMHLVISDIQKGEGTAAQTEIDSLIMDFSGHEYISNAVCEIADEYLKQGDITKSNELYQQILDNWPHGSHAMWAQMHLVISDIQKGNDTVAQTEIDKLIIDFPGHEGISNAVCSIADEYRENGYFAKANDLYQRMLDNWPSGSHSMWARMHLTRSDIERGNYSAAATVVNNLQTNFASDPDLVIAINYLAEGFYYEAVTQQQQANNEQARICYQKAITAWERIPQNWPNVEFIAGVHMMISTCYLDLNEYDLVIENFQSAIDNFKIITTNYPGADNAWHAQFMIGRCYEKMAENEMISKAQAELNIRTIYSDLVANFPNCPAAKAARDWLDNHTN